MTNNIFDYNSGLNPITKKELGTAIGVRVEIIEGLSALSDLRFYSSGIKETLTGVKYGDFCATVLGSYDSKTKIGMLRPGLWYSLSDNFSIGAEGKWSGKINGGGSGLKNGYFGIGLKLEFGVSSKKKTNGTKKTTFAQDRPRDTLRPANTR